MPKVRPDKAARHDAVRQTSDAGDTHSVHHGKRSDPMGTLQRPVFFPGEKVQDEERDEVDAQLAPEDEVRFGQELEQIASAERLAADDSEQIRLC